MSPLPLQLCHVDPTVPPNDGDVPVYSSASQLYVPTATSSTGNVTAAGTLTSNQIVIGQGSHAIATLGSLGTTVTVLHGNAAGAPSFSAVSLTADVSGTLPVGNGGTGITSLGTGVATWLGTPSSANLASAITDETGSGALVFATSPTFVTPLLGTPTSGTLTNCTGLPDGGLALTDVTTNNVSTSKHGFAPKGDGDTTKFLNANGAYAAPSASAGGAMSFISEQAPTATGVVTFSSIAATYRALQVHFTARGDQSATSTQLNLTFNNDTGSNYDAERGIFSTTASASDQVGQTSGILCRIPAATAPASYASSGILEVPYYADTTFFKSARTIIAGPLTAQSTTNIQTNSTSIFWRSTAAINRIDITLASGSYITGSKFALYGIS